MSDFKKFWKRLTTPMSSDAMSNFAPHAQQVLAFARKEADRFNHDFVGTEHLLLGIIRLGMGTAATVLQKMGLNLETIRSEIENQVGKRTDQKITGRIPYTLQVKEVLALAAEEAKGMDHPRVGTGHILLGLIREADGVAGRVLRKSGVEIEKARKEVLIELEPARSDKQSSSSQTESGPGLQNFTPRAQRVLALSRKEADRFNHNFVGTEHLLLGLIALGQGVAVNVLLKLGVDLEAVRGEVEKCVGTGPDQKMIGSIPFTPRVRKVLALADKERKALNHTYLGTEHILLGILREGDGTAARILRNLNLDLERTREEILEELDPNFGSRVAETDDSGSQSLESDTPAELRDAVYGCFTPHSRQVLALSRAEANRLKHNSVCTEHLLLAIIKFGRGTGFMVMRQMGLKLDVVGMEIEKRLGGAPNQESVGPVPYTPRVKTVLALAANEASALNHTYVGTGHILLGVLREGDNAAAQVLKSLHVRLDEARQEILKQVDSNKQFDPDQVPQQKPKDFPVSAQPPQAPIDTTTRYDVYCREGNGAGVVYRNVLFKNARGLFARSTWDVSDFLELEQGNGQTIFISRLSLVRFCPHGVKMEGEELSGDKPV